MDEAVRRANELLAKAGCKVKLTQRRSGGALSLVGTFPPKPGSGRSTPHQQKLSLRAVAGRSIPPHAQGIKRALAEAKRIDSALTLNSFDWGEFLNDTSGEDAPLAEDVIPKFESWYFAMRGRTPTTETTWDTDYWEVFKRIDPKERLTQKLLEELVLRTKPNSRSRKRYCAALSKLAEYAKLTVDVSRLRDLKGSYSPRSGEPRVLLADAEIEVLWQQIDEPKVRLWLGYLATFGLRNHELFYIDNRQLLEGGHTVTVGRLTKSKRERIAYALPREWIDKFELRQELGLTPIPGKTNRRMGEVISQAFLNRNLPTPYTFRHCWRERAIRGGIDPSVAAKSLGHSVAVSQEHYTAWITEQTCELAFAQAEPT